MRSVLRGTAALLLVALVLLPALRTPDPVPEALEGATVTDYRAAYVLDGTAVPVPVGVGVGVDRAGVGVGDGRGGGLFRAFSAAWAAVFAAAAAWAASTAARAACSCCQA